MKRGVWVSWSVGAASLGAAATRIRRRRPRGGVALVCGGSRGLGLLIARELAARDFRLAICARDRPNWLTRKPTWPDEAPRCSPSSAT